MNQEEYLQHRVEDQIDWYDRKSWWNQAAYKRLRVVEVVAAATIPLLAGYTDASPRLQVAVGILGLLVAVIAGLLSLYQFQENWMGYRSTCETLKHEKFLFLTNTEPCNIEAAFPLFVQRVESLVSKEHSSWAQYMRAVGKGRANG